MHEFLHLLEHSILHTLIDTAKVVPFLFLSYLLMEFLEHKAGGAPERWLRTSGKIGPLVGGALGVLPQCGFSAAATGFYTGRLITTGTLIAVYLSTSDEMLPILISSGAPIPTVLKLLATKLLIGVGAGFAIDGITRLLRRGKEDAQEPGIEELCERENCDCGDRFVLSALKHTAYITVFLLLFTFVLNLGIELVGEENIQSVVLGRPVLGSFLAALVGLIPNCASSVALTSLFVDGVVSSGALLSGLMVNAGVGLAILFRNNRPVRDSLRVVGILFGVSVVCGILIDLTALGAWIAM